MRTGRFALFAALLFLTSCGVRTGPTQRDSITIDRDSSKSLRAELKMGGGTLKVSGGASGWVQGSFAYNVPSWKPHVRYTAPAGRGDLLIEQPNASNFGLGSTTNEWDLRFNDDIPTEFTARLGAGEARLDLGSLSLRTLDIDLGAGELQVDLRGNPTRDCDVNIRGGAGEATIYLPRNVGIYAKATGGIGEINVKGLRAEGDHWVSDAYGTSKVQLRLDIKGGVGEINVIAE
jgi:hypothetical protein